MWNSVLAGIILDNIETLSYYQALKDDHEGMVEDILRFVSKVITDLPWFFYIPIRIFAYVIGVLCLVTTGRGLNLLSPEKRSLFLRRASLLPLYGMLNKLVRSMAFFRLFDIMPGQGCPDDTGFEQS